MGVDRLCRRRTGSDLDERPFQLDAAGFLAPYRAWWTGADDTSELVNPVELSQQHSFVLLGEPGSGKSFSLGTIAQHWRQVIGNEHVTEIDATGLTEARYRDMVATHFSPLPDDGEPATRADGGPARVLIIDQLDECPILPQLHVFLREDLAGKTIGSLRVILACRLMDYSPALHAALSDIFGHVTCDLAPLTRSQAIAIAEAEGIDAEGLVTTAALRGVGPFASIPLTLLMLCGMFRDEGDLVGSAAEIFDRAIGRLAGRSSASTWTGEVERGQRKQIATRIAARLLLSGRRNILTGPPEASRPTDLDLAEIVGGTEWDPDNSFNVTGHLVAGTIGCALFAASGADRITFRHSSMAAFMAAQYLVQRNVPEVQLRQLFLVEQFSDTTWLSIPALLRETAAWLLALRPDHGGWLVEADPLSLAAHSNLVDSANARELLVSALLRTADETYLSEIWWNRRKLVQLRHPGLGSQLQLFLDQHAADPSWRGHARTVVFLELARDAADPALAGRLVEIATSDEWSASERRLAAEAAMACDPNSAPALKTTLEHLVDPAYASAADPDDELRGALLRILWPSHLSPAELLPLVPPRPDPSMFGGYQLFLMTEAAASATKEDVVALLNLMANRAAGPEITQDPYETAESETAEDSLVTGDDDTLIHTVYGPLSPDFVMSMVGRALAGAAEATTMGAVADLLAPVLRRWHRVELPAPLDEARSPETPDHVTVRRRGLAEALIARLDDLEPGLAAHQIVSGWKPASAWQRGTPTAGIEARGTLLGGEDFAWAVQRAREIWALNGHRSALVLAEIATITLDPRNEADYELAYEAHLEEPFAGGSLQTYFSAVPIDGPAAAAGRRRHSIEAQEAWDGSEAFIVELNRLLRAAVEGEPGAFWHLAHALQFEPTTGRGEVPAQGDDILAFPAVRVLEGDAPALLRQAAYTFLMTEHDDWRNWLGSDRYDRRGWAAYFALCLLDRGGVSLAEIPWANWLGAILWSLPGNDDDQLERHDRLLGLAAANTPHELTEAVNVFVTNELTRGGHPYGLDSLATALSPELGRGLLQLAQAIRAALGPTPADIVLPGEDAARAVAVQTWRTVTALALQALGSEAADEVLDTIELVAGAEPTKLAVEASVVLMNALPQLAWPKIREGAGNDATTGLPLVYSMAHHNHYGPSLARLEDDQLAEVYSWLRTLLPPDEDETYHGAHIVGPREDAQRLRGSTLAMLVDRASGRSVELLLQLSRRFGRPLDLEAALRRARAMQAEATWRPPRPAELVILLADPARRLVRNDVELADLVIETVRAIEADLSAHGELLWDRVSAGIRRRALRKGVKLAYAFAPPDSDLWSPKPEAALSAYMHNQLTLRLSARGVFVNREVLVLPRSAYGTGDRPDLLVQVSERGNVYCRVPIEIKGSWNDEVETALLDQLAKRYLPQTQASTGVYLVGWYPLEQWTLLDPNRRPKAARRTPGRLRSDLAAAAQSHRDDSGNTIRSFVLNIPRPHARPTSRV